MTHADTSREAAARIIAECDADIARAGNEQIRNTWLALIHDAEIEALKVMLKYPQPNYVITKFAEEAGEVVKAAVHMAEGRETAENLRGEMKQVLAMLFRLWIEGDKVHGLPPVCMALAERVKNDV